MDIGYYPGCALHGSSNDYGSSVRACLAALGVGLRELDDWICCGATAAHSLNHMLAVALPARNLAIAQRDGLTELLAPCPMCSMELLKASSALAASADCRRKVSEIVELDVQRQHAGAQPDSGVAEGRAGDDQAESGPAAGRVPPGLLLRLPVDAAAQDAAVRRLRAAQFDGNDPPRAGGRAGRVELEDRVLRGRHDHGRRRRRCWSFRTRSSATPAAHGANCIVVACPMCHVNLDMKQADIDRRYGCRHDLVGLLSFRPGRPGPGARRADAGHRSAFSW